MNKTGFYIQEGESFRLIDLLKIESRLEDLPDGTIKKSTAYIAIEGVFLKEEFFVKTTESEIYKVDNQGNQVH